MGNKKVKGGLSYLWIMIAVVVWGMSFIWTNSLILAKVPVLVFTFFRILIAAIIMTAITLLSGKFVKIKKKDIKWFILLGLTEPYLYFMGETFGLQATGSPTISAIIVATMPIFTMIAGQLFYKENLGKWSIFGTFLTLPGVVMMVYRPGGFTAKYAWGIVLLFLAVFIGVAYISIVKKLGSEYNEFTITSMQFIVGAILFLPTMLIFNGKDLANINLLDKDIIIPILCLGVLCSALCYFMFAKSINELGMTRASIFNSLVPAFTALFSFLMGYETFTLLQIIGLAVVITGIIFTQKKKKETT